MQLKAKRQYTTRKHSERLITTAGGQVPELGSVCCGKPAGFALSTCKY